MSKTIKDRTGIRYGRLVAEKFMHTEWNGYTFISIWLCICDCGNEKSIRGVDLQSGNTKSCGCLKQDLAHKRTGKNNPVYKHGRRCRSIKEDVRKRDNYTCQDCNKTQVQHLTETNKKLNVHHIDGDDTNNIEENMITLCISCHNKKKKKK